MRVHALTNHFKNLKLTKAEHLSWPRPAGQAVPGSMTCNHVLNELGAVGDPTCSDLLHSHEQAIHGFCFSDVAHDSRLHATSGQKPFIFHRENQNWNQGHLLLDRREKFQRVVTSLGWIYQQHLRRFLFEDFQGLDDIARLTRHLNILLMLEEPSNALLDNRMSI